MYTNKESILKANERSEGSELITYMNKLFDRKHWVFKSAVGELSLHSKFKQKNKGSTLFPDIILFKDESISYPLIGWELKMPDVSINDEELYENAKEKADMLRTNAFVLWNFQYCRVFYRNSNGKWSKTFSREYDCFSNILIDRKSVTENKSLWKKQADKILEDLNQDFKDKKYSTENNIEFDIKAFVNSISERLTPITARFLLSLKKPTLWSKMSVFANEEHAELANISVANGSEIEAISSVYAKNIVLRWINRILFCSLISKDYNEISDILIDFIETSDIKSFSTKLNKVTEKTDFYSILHVTEEEKLVPKEVIDRLAEFCNYLVKTDFKQGNEKFTSSVLEAIVSETKRQLMGLYTTPPNLAKLLVKLSMSKITGYIADFTVGSGTIIKEIITELRGFYPIKEIHEKVWASDKYQFPLQIADLNMASNDSLNLKNIIFQHNALDLKVGEKIKIVNPATGMSEELSVPKMTNIISNLPFISSNKRSEDDKKIIKAKDGNGKLDLYQQIILHYKFLLLDSKDARIGVITSNSWFKNRKKISFFKMLMDNFDVKTIVYSNVAKWFDNAEVVATILILSPKSKRQSKKQAKIKLIGLNTDIRKISINSVNNLADEIIAEKQNENYCKYEYTGNEVISFLNTGLCMEALFDDLTWFKKVLDKKILIPLADICDIKRGTRTGADNLFITKKMETSDMDSYPYIKSIKDVSSYTVKQSKQYFFYTELTKKELLNKGHKKTLNYINNIQGTDDARKMKKKHGKMWYVPEDKPKYADFITSINPDKRLFWATFEKPTALNQRLVGASLKKDFKNKKQLIHAILNSIIPLFILSGSGFARAEGVTDLTKDGVEKLFILNPYLLKNGSEKEILDKWKSIEHNKIEDLKTQLNDSKWIDFNKTILAAYGLNKSIYYEASKSINLLISRRNRISKS